MAQMTLDEAVASARAGFLMRDRIVAVCVADYTDMALGLGESKMYMSVFASSSASIARAHEQALRMGHSAGSLAVQGQCGEDFRRMLGLAAHSWSIRPDWAFRSVEIWAQFARGAEVGVVFALGDIGKATPEVKSAAMGLRRMMDMYGVESSEPSGILKIKAQTSSLSSPGFHPMFPAWLASCSNLPSNDSSS